MEPFATTQDLTDLWRETTGEELLRAEQLLPVISDCLRYEAAKVGKNLDEMIKASPELQSVAKSVVVDITARTLLTSTEEEPMSQVSQSAMGYTWSGTYLVPGGGLFIKKSELARLGLRRQRYGAIEFYGSNQGNNDHSV